MDARPLVIGHRGASGYRPEHTAPAYKLAFELGADFVEPDVVATRDGVLVVRHENEISGTTDVAGHPEFEARRTTKTVDGEALTGWFTEDFTWAELQTLRCVERLPALRPSSAAFDGQFGILRLADLFALVDRATDARQRPLGIVAELKHAHYFGRLGLPLAELFAAEVSAAGWNGGDGRLVVESFEPTALKRVRALGVWGASVLLVEETGAPADLVAEEGDGARGYASYLTREGVAEVAAEGFDGISVPKSLLLARGDSPAAADASGSAGASDAGDSLVGHALVGHAHDAGLRVFTWTLRPENEFLDKRFRVGADPAAWGGWQAEFGAIMASGVDGVFADHPDVAVAVRGELAEH
ncbi:glycerophosphoryl diester phosphodiesterase [Subtercola lobariae]|uniref:glycerophosphodiester phosphodiesterase n=1 Tax=Subtercola lobariae TaxID=1588641 RepID=A0A917B5E5_9MICO|nr:glycerophosphoryl diester phosphodiesterase [Subtercola lobariae]